MEIFYANVIDSINDHLTFLLSPIVGLRPQLKVELESLQRIVPAIKRACEDERLVDHYFGIARYDAEDCSDLGVALYDAEDILDDLAIEASSRGVSKARLVEKVCKCFFVARQHFSSLEVAHQIHANTNNIRNFLKYNALHSIPPIGADVRTAGPFSSVIGRDDDMEIVMDFLFNNKQRTEIVPILPIVGIRGIGKTTLARLVFNDERVSDHFEMRIWVTVSSGDLDVKGIGMDILRQIHDGSTTPEVVVHDAMEVIQLQPEIEGKRFLLVLDDIRYVSNLRWSELHALLNVGAHGNKVLVTSYDMRVAKITNAPYVHVLKGLSEPQSLSLLKKMAPKENNYGQIILQSDIEEVSLKCAGVPLAIVTAGRNLWDSLNSGHDDVISVMKPWYDALSPHLKQCVAFCSLFPRDYVLSVHELINLWKAHRFIQLTGEEVGQEFVRELVSLFIFQDLVIDEYQNIVGCTMHPLYHDLARSVTRGCCTYVESSFFPRSNYALHVSTEMDNLWEQQRPEKTRTLIFLYNQIGEAMVERIFSCTKNLRVLRLRSLSGVAVSNLLGTPRRLRHLDLSESVLLKALPVSICKLLNLETLVLKNCCSLKELPSGVVEMIKLRELDLSGCSSLTHLPRGIGRLTNLQTLGLFVVGDQNEEGNEAATLNELRSLKGLRGHLEIKHLHRVTNSSSDAKLDASILEEMPNLQSLKYCWDSFDVIFHGATATTGTFLERLQPHPNLKGISIQGCCAYDDNALLKQLSRVTNLVKIDIGDCDWCTSLSPMQAPPYLKIVKLCQMRKLEYFGTLESTSSSSGGGFFPALEVLSLRYLQKLKGWKRTDANLVKETEGDDLIFPTFSAEIQLDVDHNRSFSCAHGLDSLTLATLRDRILRCWVGKEDIKGKASSESVNLQSLRGVRIIPFTSIYSISLAQLKYLKIQDMGDIRSLPKEFFQQLSSLQHLEISHGRSITTLSGTMILQHLTALETLKIVDFPDLDFSKLENDDTEEGSAKFKGRSKLRLLQISAVPKMESLPSWFQHLTEVEELVISDCAGLRTLQDNPISKFTSLRSFEIYRCEGLKDISKGVILHFIHTLESLKICGCPELDLTAGPTVDIIGRLRHVHIQQNNRMKCLPWWIQQLGSLEILEMLFCENMETLNPTPPWFPVLAPLQELRIEYCGELSKWCSANRVHLIDLPKNWYLEELQQLCIASAKRKRRAST